MNVFRRLGYELCLSIRKSRMIPPCSQLTHVLFLFVFAVYFIFRSSRWLEANLKSLLRLVFPNVCYIKAKQSKVEHSMLILLKADYKWLNEGWIRPYFFFFLDYIQVSRFLFFSILKITFVIFFLVAFVRHNSMDHVFFSYITRK